MSKDGTAALGSKPKRGKVRIHETTIRHVKGGHLMTHHMRHEDGSMPDEGPTQEQMVPQGQLAQAIQASGVDDGAGDAAVGTE